MEIEEAIARWREFWRGEGCELLEPWSGEIPSPRLSPHVFPAFFGPGPRRLAGTVAVYRPLEGRYGEHPYRLARPLECYALVKPVPEDGIGLLKRALGALGAELGEHDLRFSSRLWREPLVGGHGRGFRVLLDGLEIARLTWVDRLGGHELEVPSFEIGVDLELFLTALGGAASIFELHAPGEARRRSEAEASRYTLETADPDGLSARLSALEREVARALEAGLPRAAFELALRCRVLIDEIEARRQAGSWARRPVDRRLEELMGEIARTFLPEKSAAEPSDGEAKAETSTTKKRASGRGVKKRGRKKKKAEEKDDG